MKLTCMTKKELDFKELDLGIVAGGQFGQFKVIPQIEQNLQFAAEVEKSITLISFANSYSNGKEESDVVFI